MPVDIHSTITIFDKEIFISALKLTIDVIYWRRFTGQVQNWAIAAIDVLDDGATQRGSHIQGKEHTDTEQSDHPGQDPREEQPRRCHDGMIPQWLTHC